MKIPKRFGKYTIIEEIGAGSMGLVLKAQQDFIERKVAIKILPKELEKSQPMLVKRFRQEAIVAAKIIHPYLVPIFDVGYDADFHYIVMEFVQGKILDVACAEKNWGVLELSDIFIKITKALVAIHSVEIVHRDLKASNIIYSNEGLIKILDFGIAKAANDDANLTKAGCIMGSPDFMSPEQARAEEVDHRSDIFSFGVVMFFLLTRINPFHRKKMEVREIIKNRQRHLHPPSMNEVKADIPTSIDRIVMKCLHGSRNQRYQSSEELLEDLERCKRGLLRKKNTAPYLLSSANLKALPSNESFDFKKAWKIPLVVGILCFFSLIFMKIAYRSYRSKARYKNLQSEITAATSKENYQKALFLIQEYLSQQGSSEEESHKKLVQKFEEQQEELHRELLVYAFYHYSQELLKKNKKEEVLEIYDTLKKHIEEIRFLGPRLFSSFQDTEEKEPKEEDPQKKNSPETPEKQENPDSVEKPEDKKEQE